MAFVRFDEAYHVWRSDRVGGFRTYPNNSYPFRALYAPYAGVATDVSGDDELVAAVGVSPGEGDPVRFTDTASQAVCDPVYERLVAVDWDGDPRPELASEAERLDETTYEFRLREGVRFHPSDRFDFDGREASAEDVAFSVRRYLGTPRESVVGDWLGVDGDDGFEGDVDVVGDYTVRFSLPAPYADFEYAAAGVPVVPREAGYPESHPRGEAGTLDLGAEPVGTGAFRFAGATDERWRLERFEDHWFDGDDPVYDVDVPDSPPLSAVTFRVITDSGAQAAALRAGGVDLAGGVPPATLAEFEAEEAFDVHRNDSSGFDLLAYPVHEAADTPFQNRKVRLAVNRLIDRERVVEEVFDGVGRPAYTPIPLLAGDVTSAAFREEMAEGYARYYGRE